MDRIAVRYAKMLLQHAIAQKALASIHADVQLLHHALVDHPALLHTLKSPIIDHTKKHTILQTLFRHKLHAPTLQFLALVLQKRREVLLPNIVQAFLAQHDQQQGIQRAQVTTTFPLSDALAQQMQQLVKQFTPCQHVVLEQRLDPALIGGFVLQTADQRLDQSLRRQLSNIKKLCVAPGY